MGKDTVHRDIAVASATADAHEPASQASSENVAVADATPAPGAPASEWTSRSGADVAKHAAAAARKESAAAETAARRERSREAPALVAADAVRGAARDLMRRAAEAGDHPVALGLEESATRLRSVAQTLGDRAGGKP